MATTDTTDESFTPGGAYAEQLADRKKASKSKPAPKAKSAPPNKKPGKSAETASELVQDKKDPNHDGSNTPAGSSAWQKLVGKEGVDKARIAAPELDPAYQKLVASEGQAKGSAAYSKQFIDPINERGPGTDLPAGLEAAGKDLIGPFLGMATAAATSGSGGSGKPAETPAQKAAAAKAASTAKAAAAQTAAQKALTTEQTAIANSPATKMMDGLINDYQTAMKADQPYLSGQAGENAVAASNVGAGLPANAGDPKGEAMLANDQANVGAAVNAGNAGVTQAMQNMGTANAEALQVAPYQALLQGLQSEAQYKIETGTGATAPADAPGWYKAALSMAGDSATSPSGASLPGLPAVKTSGSSSSPSTDTGDGASGS